MAVVAVKSGNITSRDASPRVKSNPSVVGGKLQSAVGVAAISNGDSVGSTYRMFQIPSNARMDELLISAPDIGTTTIADFGIYETTDNGGLAVDADRFASAQSLKDGALAKFDVLHESGSIALSDLEKPLWEMLGLTEDPGKNYDVVATLTGAADAAGSLAVLCRYQQG